MHNSKDERILAALLSTSTVKQAARESGLSPNTIYKRLNDPEFSDRYYEARLELLKGHVATLHGFLGAAIGTLGQIMVNPDASPQTRLNAAEAIIRNCLKLTEEVDILKRLEALENEYK